MIESIASSKGADWVDNNLDNLVLAGKYTFNNSGKTVTLSMNGVGTFSEFCDTFTDIKNGKIVFNSIDDVINLGISSVDDLMKLGVSSVDDLSKLKVSSIDDLAKIGIKNKNDLAKLGIDSSDLKKLGIYRTNEIEVNFNYNSKYDEAEFSTQLADQEAGMNKLTVDEYLKNRDRYLAEGRAIEGNMAQKVARENAYLDKVTELRRSGLSPEQAKIEAKKWIDTQAALHNPDQIAGENPTIIGGVGDKKINSSIGSQWKYRIDEVDELIRKLADSMTELEKQTMYLNVRLKY